MKTLVGANPYCVRLGRWPEALPALTREASFRALDWPAAQAQLAALKLSKYCDYNLVNLIAGHPAKHTFEVRVLPAYLEAAPIVEAAALFEALLLWCCADTAGEAPASLAALLAALPFSEPSLRRRWQAAAARV